MGMGKLTELRAKIRFQWEGSCVRVLQLPVIGYETELGSEVDGVTNPDTTRREEASANHSMKLTTTGDKNKSTPRELQPLSICLCSDVWASKTTLNPSSNFGIYKKPKNNPYIMFCHIPTLKQESGVPTPGIKPPLNASSSLASSRVGHHGLGRSKREACRVRFFFCSCKGASLSLPRPSVATHSEY